MQHLPSKLTLVAVSVAAALTLAACGKEEPPPPPPTTTTTTLPPKPEVTVKLGHVAPMTGPQAHLGKDNENGAVLTIEELNAQGLEIGGAKIKFELLAEDDQADAKQGPVVAQKLADAKVNGVIGHLNSSTTIPASKVYSDAGVPQISGSATAVEYTNQGFTTAFRVMANDARQGKALGEFAAKQGFKSVAIIDDRTAYGKGLAEQFKLAVDEAKIKVVATEFTTDKATDFKAILTKIKGKKPDLVFFAGMDPQGAPMLKQMKELGIKAKFLGGDGVCTADLPKNAGDAAEGSFCSLPGMPLEQLANGPAFKEKFAKKFNTDIQLYAPYVYDAVMVMVDAMKRANSVESAKFLPEIGKTKYEGVTATIEFDEKGDLKNGAVSIYQYKSGKREYVETIGAPAAPAPTPAPAAEPAAAAPAAAPAPA
ncbi:MAG TPA: branched-chain amino acid ABC transporter substrate-binding protein, partial [Rhodocyclaceae bacterium]|nr:branched-chain amino acid ABC transporter substrate-binding protein [Rhodocyclaceae bacterium]